MLALAAGALGAGRGRVRAAVVFVVASAVAATRHGDVSGHGRHGTAGARWARGSAPVAGPATPPRCCSATPTSSRPPGCVALPAAVDPADAHPRPAPVRPPDGAPRTAAPTWVVAWGGLDPWHIDAHGRTRLTLATHYHRVAGVCGHVVYLHDGVRRALPPGRTGC